MKTRSSRGVCPDTGYAVTSRMFPFPNTEQVAIPVPWWNGYLHGFNALVTSISYSKQYLRKEERALSTTTGCHNKLGFLISVQI